MPRRPVAARRATAVLLLVVALVLAACADPDTEPDPDPGAGTGSAVVDAAPDAAGPGATDAAGPVLTVVAKLAPLADLVAQVGGQRVEVVTFIPAGADSHTYEPRPGDVVGLGEADAFLGIGLELNPAAVRLARETLPDGAPLVLLGEQALRDDALVFDHSHDHGHSHGDDDHGHSHGHSHGEDGELGPNPHVWTSLRNAAELVDAIAGVLGELDPDGAEQYLEAAAAYRAELEQLDRLIGDATATIPARNRTLITYHDAWTYFARDHRLEFATAVQPSDYTDPSAAEVRAVIDLVRDLEVPAVFGSEVFPTPVLEAIAEETGAVYVGDLADDVLPGEPGSPQHRYLELMRRNAALIVDALGGDASQLRG